MIKLIRHIGVSALLLAFISMTAPSTTKWLMFLSFRDTIEQQFCVNKEKPELLCGGSCHLNTVIHEDQSETEKPIIPDFMTEIELSPIEHFSNSLFCIAAADLKLWAINRQHDLDKWKSCLPEDLEGPPPRA